MACLLPYTLEVNEICVATPAPKPYTIIGSCGKVLHVPALTIIDSVPSSNGSTVTSGGGLGGGLGGLGGGLGGGGGLGDGGGLGGGGAGAVLISTTSV